MPLTEELTFLFKDDGVVLNSDSTSFPFVDITQVDGLDSAPFRVTEHDFEGADGGFVDAQFEKARTIVLGGTVYGNSSSLETYLDALKYNFAPTESAFPLYIKAPGVSERLLFCKSLGVRYSWTTARRLGMTPIQFILTAENPSILGAHHVTTPISLPAGTTNGRGYPRLYPLTYGGGSINFGGISVNNGGNKPADALFIINGPIGNFRILSETVSRYLDVQVDMLPSDQMIIDTRLRTVFLNNVNRVNALTAGSSWFRLMPGLNSLRFTASIAGTGTLTIDFYDAYR